MPDQPYETRPAPGYREYPPPMDLRDCVACTLVRQVGAVPRPPQTRAWSRKARASAA